MANDSIRHVAFLVAEMAPMVKVGGLADVAGSLPAALAENGVQVTILMPAYGTIDREKFGVRVFREGLSTQLGDETVGFSLLEADGPADGVRVFLVEHNDFFHRAGVYVDPETKEEYPDTGLRFTFFTRAALEGLRALGEPVDVIHSHDHQTALAPALTKIQYADDPVLGESASVYTLHNLGYQGIHDPSLLDAAGIGSDQCQPGSDFEYWGNANYMKIGISFADKVSTVSETYAKEICHDETQSAGLATVLQTREQDLVGIVNGIHTGEWNPATDEHLVKNYTPADVTGKRDCKRALLETMGMDTSDLETPILGVVTRLVDQKGLDILAEAFDSMMERKVRFVLLGTGLEKYEQFFEEAVARFPGRVGTKITFNNALAHQIEAGVDMFLMPSLYEPCGLNQLYSLRYGTVPVVRSTGGLADTVPDADAHADGLGFAFTDYTSEAMLETIDRALAAYGDVKRWSSIRKRGMEADLSWGASAGRYLELYREATSVRAKS